MFTQTDLQTIVPVVREVVRADCGRSDTCILTTRVLIGVLARRSIPAQAVAMQIATYNPMAARYVREHGFPNDAAAVAALDAAGGYIGIAGSGEAPQRKGRWDGHLVAFVNACWLVDATLDQMSRPQRNVHFEPLVASVPRRAIRKRVGIRLFVGQCMVEYEPLDDRRWESSVDWTDPHIEQIVDEIDAYLKAPRKPA
jgi:hypothetical protein